jgi:hypothetical protein
MINPQVCRRCEHFVTIDEGKSDENGDPLVYTTIICRCGWPDRIKRVINELPGRLYGTHLFMEDDPPEGCAYVTEHVITLGGVDTSEDKFWGPKSNED